MGDPSGIGPEVIAKALKKPSLRNLGPFVILGDKEVYQRYAAQRLSHVLFLDLKTMAPHDWQAGRPTLYSAKASLRYLQKAVELLKNKTISALVTAPVCKEGICQFYPSFQGHTEFFAQAFHTQNVGMMFVAGGLRILIATRHIPLAHVSRTIDAQRLYQDIELVDHELKRLFHLKRPNIAVCGLNPHAGEGGRMGTEEIIKIIPAIQKARRRRINVEGPFAADTLFTPPNVKKYAAVIAMYHDQGLIAMKTLAFAKAVNLTLGLPFIRTSPAHGTAFDIAGKNRADPSSMAEALQLAAHLSHAS